MKKGKEDNKKKLARGKLEDTIDITQNLELELNKNNEKTCVLSSVNANKIVNKKRKGNKNYHLKVVTKKRALTKGEETGDDSIYTETVSSVVEKSQAEKDSKKLKVDRKEDLNTDILDSKDKDSFKIDEDPYLLKEATYIRKNELWKNKQRVLIVRSSLKKKNCKSFIENLKLLLPHHKVESKWNKKATKSDLSDISYSRNCNNIIFFDIKRKRYCLWICKNVTGPSLYFEILDYIPLHSLIFSGNCLLYSRPLLIFSKHFDELEHLKLIKEMFIHVFGIPNYHPLSKPFYDHCYNFFYTNNLIYFRHYQILPLTLVDSNNINKQKLVEIGPQFTLHIIKIFEECFKGRIIFENVNYKDYVTVQQMKMQKNIKKKIKRLEKKEKTITRLKSIRTPIKTDIDF
ncbi:ribosome biogenesis protein BRX1 [Plasmodium brasilianum]|uniref:BRIX domain n=2 Tax=Plasmodium (Plasmodium) TaxID=418103 RepID=A0A1A8VR70_PLAMA|nr:ribosome biogenesis protein BRX1 homolog, putative [Plasmodium malariae]KAI4840992.1 ribosome biogenesis protein BRX1 [Plasmodium brasilianum]SBS81811.1 BRIX domain [Plasmodium malariae]SBT87194.1 ribosome biogenesis protein BRX1 homolog, putative [Plasmodium malariae]